MRHARRAHRPVHLAMAVTAVLGGAAAGAVLLGSGGDLPGYDSPRAASYGAPVAAAATSAPSTAVPATGSTPAAGTAPTTPPATALPAVPPAGPVVAASGPAPGARVATRGSGRLLAATLTGDVEVPGPGDPDGVGVAAVRVAGTGRICLEAVTTGLERITKLHIHRGARGVAGPVVVDFPVTGAASTAACTTVDRALAGRIRANPENWYVNVHTAAFDKGALRGQLMW